MNLPVLDGALCAQSGAPAEDDWYKIGEERDYERRHIAVLKAFCARCPVQVACLQWALDTDDAFGVFAGTTPRERKLIARRRGAA